MKAETAGLVRNLGDFNAERENLADIWQIRAAEEVQTLIRQLQEMWLFGRLNALEGKKEREEVDGTAREVAELVRKLTAKSGGGQSEALGKVEGNEDGEAMEL
jgi:hypothetical protein